MTAAADTPARREEAAPPPGPPQPSVPPHATRRRHRRRSDAGPLLLFALLGVLFVLPFAPRRIVESPANDLGAHLAGIMEARYALLEGQFPVRVAPHQVQAKRYPIHQFYGNFPYTAGALFTFLPGAWNNPYTAWKLVTFLAVTCAGFYTYRSGLALTRQAFPALVAGAVFVLAPYFSTSARSRFAYPEAISLCLLPAVFYYSWRAFASRRRALRAIVPGGVAWALLAMSHNITLLFGATFVAAFFLTCLTLRPSKDVPRLLRFAACSGLGVALALWYLAPQIKVLHTVPIAQGGGPPGFSYLTTLPILLSPFMKQPDQPIGTANFGAQIGWPTLAAALAAVVLLAGRLFRRLPGAGRRFDFGHAMAARLLLFLLVAVVLTWTPSDVVWRLLPQVYYNVQFPYRVLMFVILFGSLLSAVALALAFGRRGGGGMPAGAALACLFAVGLAAAPYSIWRRGKLPRGTLEDIVARAYMGGQGEHNFRPLVEKMPDDRWPAPAGVPLVPVAETQKAVAYGKETVYASSSPRPVVVQLPVLFYPGLLDVRVNGQRVRHGHIEGMLALDLPAGAQVVTAEFVGVRWANVVSGIAAVLVLGAAGAYGAARLRSRRLSAGRRSHRGGVAGAIVPVRMAAVGFALAAVPVGATALYTPVRQAVYRRAVGVATASSESNEELKIANAFDDDPRTAWAAAGGGPAVVTVAPPQAKVVSGVTLQTRQTGLLEGWHTVQVLLYRRGRVVADHTFSLPDAGRQAVHELKLAAPAKANKIELRFSDPVTYVFGEDRHVDKGAVNPGYREIRIHTE